MSLSITIENLTVELGGKVIFENVNFDIKKNESIVLIGPSGGGKTVLLKALAGIYVPNKGVVRIDGVDWQTLQNESKHKLARKLGMLFQQGALFDQLTVLENVEFPIREHYKYSEEKIHELAKSLLNRVNLGESLNKVPFELSGGMQRRLGIARALALNPEVVFYDDPIVGQDPIQGDMVMKLISEYKEKNNSTVIMSSSNMRFAYHMADRIFMVVNQEVIDCGTPDEIKLNTDPRVHQFIRGEVEGPLSAR